MNRRLIDPFQATELPETVEEVLQRGTATCAEFNSWGTLLAAGGDTGEVIIWDFETKGVARASQPHDQAVTCVAWSRDGRHVVSVARDCTVSSLSILDNKQVAKVKLPTQPVAVCVNRNSPSEALVSMKEGAPILVDLATGTRREVPCVPSDSDARKGPRSSLGGAQTACAVFSRDGRCIYLGQSRGYLCILDRDSLQFLDVVRLASGPRISSIKLDRKGRRLLASCSDRVLRVAEVAAPSEQQRQQAFPAEQALSRARIVSRDKGADKAGLIALSRQEFQAGTVERSSWQAAAFSFDSEHVAGATAGHKIYAWSLHSGILGRFLEFEGTSDELLHMAWHPKRSCFLTVGTSGKIYVWAQVYKENWSAFAPDFTELEENQEYIEREDEFDINPRPDEKPSGACANGKDDEELDVETAEPIEALYCSSDEDVATAPPRLHHLPLEIEPQRPSTPEPNAAEDADAEDDDEEADEDMVSLSPSQDAAPGQPGEAGPLGQGGHKRPAARSRSRSMDAGEMPPALRQKGEDGGGQRGAGLLRDLNQLDLPPDLI